MLLICGRSLHCGWQEEHHVGKPLLLLLLLMLMLLMLMLLVVVLSASLCSTSGLTLGHDLARMSCAMLSYKASCRP